jgi:hypothetical protein
MLAYAFFHPQPCELFCRFVRGLGLDPQLQQEDLSTNVLLPEGLEDELSDRIEDYYDELLDQTEALVSDGEDYLHNVGVSVHLKDGRSVLAAVAPELVNKLLDSLTMEEIGAFVNAIADAVENPDERPLCKR